MEQLSKITQQTFWQILGKIVTSFSTIIILSIITRNYHESGTGVFTLVLTYLAIFNLLSDFGFNAHALKGIQDLQWQKLLGTRILWSILLTILAVGLLFLLPFNTPPFFKATIFGSLGIVGSAIFLTCNLIFQSKHRYDLSVLASISGSLVGLALYLLLSLLHYPIHFLLTAYCVSWLMIAFSSLFLVKRFLSSLLPVFDKRYTINLFKKTWPIAATLVLNVVYFRTDAFIVTFYKGTTDAGIYNVAYSVFQSVLVLPTFIINAYYPLMLKSLSKLKLIAAVLLGLSLVGTISTFFLSSFVIKLITGGGFEGSFQSLNILSLGFPAFFVSSLLMWVFITRGWYKRMLLIYICGLIFNLTLNFIFIPQYSFWAASWITVISEYLILTMLAVSLI